MAHAIRGQTVLRAPRRDGVGATSSGSAGFQTWRDRCAPSASRHRQQQAGPSPRSSERPVRRRSPEHKGMERDTDGAVTRRRDIQVKRLHARGHFDVKVLLVPRNRSRSLIFRPRMERENQERLRERSRRTLPCPFIEATLCHHYWGHTRARAPCYSLGSYSDRAPPFSDPIIRSRLEAAENTAPARSPSAASAPGRPNLFPTRNQNQKIAP